MFTVKVGRLLSGSRFFKNIEKKLQSRETLQSGEIDPQTGQRVSVATAERALLVIEAFEIIVTEKELRN